MNNDLLIYGLKVSLSVAVLYLLYKICFTRDTFFTLRRIYIFLTVVISLLLPFVVIGISNEVNDNVAIKTITAPIVILATEGATTAQKSGFNFTIVDVLCVAALLGSILLFIQLIFYFYKVTKLINNNEVENIGKYRLIKLSENKLSSFSFFNLIFIDPSTNEKMREKILTHEQIHASQYHSIDLLLMEIFLILFWWNPFVWLLKKEMKINHEFLADNGVLEMGYDKKEYQYTLLNYTTKNTGISIINSFNVSQLTQRVIMMNKKRTSLISSVKYLLAVPVLSILLICNSTNAAIIDTPNELTNMETTDTVVKETSGGMYIFIRDNLRYPFLSQQDQVTGIATVSFTIDKNGGVKNVKVLNSPDQLIEKEVLRVMNMMPKLTPVKENGKPIESNQQLKIKFDLQDAEGNNVCNSELEADVIVIAYL